MLFEQQGFAGAGGVGRGEADEIETGGGGKTLRIGAVPDRAVGAGGERVVEQGVELLSAEGVDDQLHLRGVSEEAAMAVRLVAHWLAFAPLLLLATLPAAALLGLSGETMRTVLLSLLAGTPGLAAVGLAVAALTASLRGGAALAGLMVIPLAVPILIFGAGALSRPDPGALLLTGAISLGLCAVTPFAAGAAIRAAREG